MSNSSSVQLNDVKVERAENGEATLRIEVAPESVQTMRARVLKDLSKRLRVPGFRPGHVPANIVKRQIGDEAIAQNVSDEIVPLAYQAALEQSELRPLNRAQVDDVTFDALEGDQPFSFVARFVAAPEMELPDYKGMEVGKPRVEVSDDDVEKGMEELRQQRANLKDVEGRGAQNGDVINIRLSVKMDGEERGEPTNLRPFLLGQSGFVPSIDEHLEGIGADEERTFTVTYPEDFHDGDLAGKEAEFTVKTLGLKERELPELNEEFATALNMANLDEVRTRMREAIQDGRERESRQEVRMRLVNALRNQTDFQIPQTLLDERVQGEIERIENEIKERGGNIEEMLEREGETREEFEANLRDAIDTDFRQELLLEEIAHREKITISPQEFENYYMQLAMYLNVPVEEAVKNIDVDTARKALMQSKAIDIIEESAVLHDDEPLSEDDEDYEIVEVGDALEDDDALNNEADEANPPAQSSDKPAEGEDPAQAGSDEANPPAHSAEEPAEGTAGAQGTAGDAAQS